MEATPCDSREKWIADRAGGLLLLLVAGGVDVAFGANLFKGQDPWSRALGVAMMVAGVTLAAGSLLLPWARGLWPILRLAATVNLALGMGFYALDYLLWGPSNILPLVLILNLLPFLAVQRLR